MAKTNSTKSNKVDPTRPFFAAVGGVDLAVAAARTGLTEAQTRLAKVDFEPKSLATGLQKEAKALVSGTVDDLNKQYVDLAARGRVLVARIRGQQATQELKAQAAKTTTRAKTTATQAKNAATQTKNAADTVKSSAKATGTSAKESATAGAKATQDAAAKTGA